MIKEILQNESEDHEDIEFHNYILGNDYMSFNNWLKIIKTYIELCDNMDFIKEKTIIRLIYGRMYRVLKLIIKKRTLPLTKNEASDGNHFHDQILLNHIFNNTLTNEIIKEYFPKFDPKFL